MDNKFKENENAAFKNDGLFMDELQRAQAGYPDDIIQFKILEHNNNWISDNIANVFTTERIFSKKVFQSIEKQTNNSIYSLNIEMSINDTDNGWDPNGKFDFSLNIASINDKKSNRWNLGSNYLNNGDLSIKDSNITNYKMYTSNNSGQKISLSTISSNFSNIENAFFYIKDININGSIKLYDNVYNQVLDPYPHTVNLEQWSNTTDFSKTENFDENNFSSIEFNNNSRWWNSPSQAMQKDYDVKLSSWPVYYMIQVFPLLQAEGNNINILIGAQFYYNYHYKYYSNNFGGSVNISSLSYDFNNDIWNNIK